MERPPKVPDNPIGPRCNPPNRSSTHLMGKIDQPKFGPVFSESKNRDHMPHRGIIIIARSEAPGVVTDDLNKILACIFAGHRAKIVTKSKTEFNIGQNKKTPEN